MGFPVFLLGVIGLCFVLLVPLKKKRDLSLGGAHAFVAPWGVVKSEFPVILDRYKWFSEVHMTLPFLVRFPVFLFSHWQILFSAGFWSIEFIHRFICLHRMPGISVAHMKSVDALLGSVTPFGEKRALVPGALAACVSCVSVRRLPCPGHSRRGWLAPTHEALARGC